MVGCIDNVGVCHIIGHGGALIGFKIILGASFMGTIR